MFEKFNSIKARRALAEAPKEVLLYEAAWDDDSVSLRQIRRLDENGVEWLVLLSNGQEVTVFGEYGWWRV